LSSVGSLDCDSVSPSQSINTQKKELGQYPSILTEQAWSIIHIIFRPFDNLKAYTSTAFVSRSVVYAEMEEVRLVVTVIVT